MLTNLFFVIHVRLLLAFFSVDEAWAVKLGGTIDTLVGSPNDPYQQSPLAVWADQRNNNVFVMSNNYLRRIEDGTGAPKVVAGSAGFKPLPCDFLDPSGEILGDNRPSVLACVSGGSSVATDSAGNTLFVADDRVRKVRASDGTVITLAGNGTAAFCGNDAPAVKSCLAPEAIVVDKANNIIVAEQNIQRVRKISVSTGLLTAVAGGGCGDIGNFSGDGGPAVDACLNVPSGVALLDDDIYIADARNNRVRVVWAASGFIDTVVGGGNGGAPSFCGDGGAATNACLDTPAAIAFSAGGDMAICDAFNSRVRIVAKASGNITTFAGNGQNTYCGEGGLASKACVGNPSGVSFDSAGNMWIAAGTLGRLLVVWATNLTISSRLSLGQFCGDGSLGADACLHSPVGMAFSVTGDLYIADSMNSRVRVLSRETGRMSTAVGNGDLDDCGDGGPAIDACLLSPWDVAFDRAGNLFVLDQASDRVRVVWANNGTIAAYAGGGNDPGLCIDGVLATQSCLDGPSGVAVDCSDNLLIADTFHGVVRVVDSATGIIGPFAGEGGDGTCGDGGLAVDGCLGWPEHVAVDRNSCNVYIADSIYNVIRVVYVNGTMGTLAGNSSQGFSGDGGPATLATLWDPHGLAVDASGNVLIADSGDRVRIVWALNGTIDLVAGVGLQSILSRAGFCGDGGPATEACFNNLQKLAVDAVGNVVISDQYNDRVRIVLAADSVLCPLGYSCPLGVPVACTSVASYCPGNTTTALSISDGYYAVSDSSLSIPVVLGQLECPLGSYCIDGVRTSCPPGTVGVAPGKSTIRACALCPANTYAALAGSADASGACLRCPRGSVSAGPGASFCIWCPPATVFDDTGTCRPCPPGTYSLGGETPCSPIPGRAAHVVWDAFSVLAETGEKPLSSGLTVAAATTRYTIPIVLPLLLVAVLPALYILCCASLFGANTGSASVHGRVLGVLQTIDQFGMNHAIAERESPTLRKTPFGGALSIFALGVISAIAVSLMVQFKTSNAETELPVLAPTTNSYADVPPATADVGESGIRIVVFVMGPACASVSWTLAGFLSGNFSYSSSFNSSTGSARHEFTCPGCALTPISALDLTFDGTCQTFIVNTYAVSSFGFVSAASYTVSAPCGPLFSLYSARTGCAPLAGLAPAVAMTMTLDLLQLDGVNKYRGFAVQPSATLPPSGANASSSGILLRVALPLSSYYVAKAIDTRTSLAQLFSSILGLVGVLSAFGAAVPILEALPAWRRALLQRCTMCKRSGQGRGGNYLVVGAASSNDETTALVKV